MTLSQRIREYRYSKGWGPDELAGRANISRTALYQIECGRTEAPRAGTLCRIAKALGIGVESLLGSHEAALGRALAGEAELGSDGGAAWPEPADGLISDESPHATNRIAAVRRIGLSGSIEPRAALDDLMDSPYAETVIRLLNEMHRLLPEARERSAS